MTAAQIAYAVSLNHANKIKFLLHTIQLLEKENQWLEAQLKAAHKDWDKTLKSCTKLRRELELLRNSP